MIRICLVASYKTNYRSHHIPEMEISDAKSTSSWRAFSL